MHTVMLNEYSKEQFLCLTSQNKRRVAQKLRSLFKSGFSRSCLLEDRWLSENDFHCLLARRPGDMDLESGTILRGVVEGQKIMIHSIERVERSIDLSRDTLERATSIRADEDYRTISPDWIASLVDDPFTKKALDDPDFHCMRSIPSSRVLHASAHFYKSLEEIRTVHKAAKTHGIVLPVNWQFEECGIKVKRFEDDCSAPEGRSVIFRFLNSFKIRRDTFGIVTFVDETCPFSMAQADFARLVLWQLKDQFPDLKTCIAEIIVRTAEGRHINQDVYHHCHSTNRLPDDLRPRPLSPFSMVYGGVDDTIALDQMLFPSMDDRRWFDFDIFNRCDLEACERLDDVRMQTNTRINYGQVISAAGYMMGPGTVRIEVRDFSHLERATFVEALKRLKDTAAMVLVHKDIGKKDLNAVGDACGSSAVAGMPSTMLIKTSEVRENEACILYGYHLENRYEIEDIHDNDEVTKAMRMAYNASIPLRPLRLYAPFQ